MSVWEYKVITSGKGGFATPALMESFLNQLGRDEWEILDFRQAPENPLAFTGLARRPTQRDWTLEDAVAAAARTEADKLRAEFEAKFKGNAPAADERVESVAGDEKAASEEGFRKVRDTERDLDPDAPDDDGERDEWDKLTTEDELPTFFEAIRPHMRRNQRGPGLSVGVDHLARRWELTEDEVISALKECGFVIPEDEDAKPECLEYEGDLYWVNVNRRGERWINTKEKPRAAFRIVKGSRPAESPGGEGEGEAAPTADPRPADSGRQQSGRARYRDSGPSNAGPLPSGQELLERIRPLMRRSRRGPGGSGSIGFLSRALKCSEADLGAGFAALGLKAPETQGEKPAFVEVGDSLWWLNQDQRGGVWINERDKRDARDGEEGAESEATAPNEPLNAGTAEAEPAGGSPLAALRLLLKRTKTGSHSGETGKLAATLGKSPEELLAALTAAGLHVPEKARAKPVFVEHAGEIYWLNLNSKGELWLNAKASKYAKGEPDHGEEAPEPAVQEAAEATKAEAAPSE
jgi:hypothetical protein